MESDEVCHGQDQSACDLSLRQLRREIHKAATEVEGPYQVASLNSYGRATGLAAVKDETTCKAAAASLGMEYVGSRSDGGAPSGCFYLADDSGRPAEVGW